MKNFSKYYQRTIEERRAILADYLEESQLPQLSEYVADHMIENYVMNYALPLGLAPNIQVDDERLLIPLVIEEPSVVAALSYAGKLLGRVHTSHTERTLTGQIIFSEVTAVDDFIAWLAKQEEELLELAKSLSKEMVSRGGGPRGFHTKAYSKNSLQFVTLYLTFDPVDAMGANTINTVLEGLAKSIESQRPEKVLMAILSNYSEHSLATARVKVPVEHLHANFDEAHTLAKRLTHASNYANIDPYRAVTHNKGIMNGIDALAIATGNDWRAIEASVHAYASRSGHYQALSQWSLSPNEEFLVGELTLPLPVGTVGGTLRIHPQAQWSLNILGQPTARRLAEIMVAVGLLQNFAALRALVSEGIQAGHMNLHASSLAIQVGAKPEELPYLLKLMKTEDNITFEQTFALLQQLRLKEL